MKKKNKLFRRVNPSWAIFQSEIENYNIFYVPGNFALVKSQVSNSIKQAWKTKKIPKSVEDRELMEWLEDCAKQAKKKWRKWIEKPFKPECLTLYLSNKCNVACLYCYSSKKDKRISENLSGESDIIKEEVVHSASQLVAKNCADKGKPFYLVVQGGGEPTIHWELLGRIVKLTRETAEKFGIGWSSYISTNGVVPKEKARLLARYFTMIGLSCDGPPDIQDSQRPLKNNGKSSKIVEETASVFTKTGARFVVRSTITPETMERQTEIVRYLHETLGASQMRFEPVYYQGKAMFTPGQANVFLENFLRAREVALSLGCSLSISGVRLNEIHGTYCDILRDVLRLTPDGIATACFYHTDGKKASDLGLDIGYFDSNKNQFILKEEKIALLRRTALNIPQNCQDCINVYHCARVCPEFCYLTSKFPAKTVEIFRCKLQRNLAEAQIIQAAEELCKKERQETKNPTSRQEQLLKELKEVSPFMNADNIVHQWKSIEGKHNIENGVMPSPIWTERKFEHNGKEAWQQIVNDFPGKDNYGPISIYFHVPFCDRKCGFCDCHSVPLARNKRQRAEQFSKILMNEIEIWARIPSLSKRPVTTIHFGGGTPNYLDWNLLKGVVENCRTHFNTTSSTEWALESTSSLLSKEHLKQLKKLGFSRLHVGVQTLEEQLREKLGRKDRPMMVLEKISNAIDMGFVTSVDIIYGLPGQRFKGLIETLKLLLEIGVYGFSLYRLNISNRNRNFLEKKMKFIYDPFHTYLLLQAAEQVLISQGYKKNFFNHFAKPEDLNLYSTHAKRGEDLLSLGPTADGVFGFYHYRHPDWKKYVSGTDFSKPVLEGGLWESGLERKLRPAKRELMGNYITRSLFRKLNAEPLLDSWLNDSLLRKDPANESFGLTANGTWLINEMITKLENRLREVFLPEV